MQITHAEAHKLIQFNADGELEAQQRNLLALHLEECAKCQQYAYSIARMESVLQPMLQRNWDRRPLPLSIDLLTAKSNPGISERIMLATRIAAFAVVFIGFFFSAWNFTVSSRRTPTPFLPSVPIIPTPFRSTITAGTGTGFENCTMTSYIVEKSDTLASIADRFSVPADHILQINSMRNEAVIVGQALSIPMCNSTPTNPAASHTTTFTPVRYSITTTPGG